MVVRCHGQGHGGHRQRAVDVTQRVVAGREGGACGRGGRHDIGACRHLGSGCRARTGQRDGVDGVCVLETRARELAAVQAKR